MIEKCKSYSEMGRALGYPYYNGNVKKFILNYCKDHNLNADKIIETNNKKEIKLCLYCGKTLEPNQFKFCCHSHSASYNNLLRNEMTQEQKNKIRNTLKSKIKKNGYKQGYKTTTEWIKCGKILNTNNIKYTDKYLHESVVGEKECVICHKKFIPNVCLNGRVSKKSVCSDECHSLLRRLRGQESATKIIKDGRHKGWKSRKIDSYPEKFWIQVLKNNNIVFDRENYENGRYFLDFHIVKNGKEIDLEIDGKQHTYIERKSHDMKRDSFLREKGYIIYRIPWNSINKEKGKILMKEKINKFLEFYNSL